MFSAVLLLARILIVMRFKKKTFVDAVDAVSCITDLSRNRLSRGKSMKAKLRTRMSPEDRRAQLLDVTKALIIKDGMNSFTIELLSLEAGVSIPLVYKYFDTRLELLQDLLLREYQSFYGNLKQELKSVVEFEVLVEKLVSVNFDEISSGNIVSILREQSDVNEVILSRHRKAHSSDRLIFEKLQNQYGYSDASSEFLVRIASAASYAAAEHFRKSGGDRSQLINKTVKFILGGIGNAS